jgi:hypothetical protein
MKTQPPENCECVCHANPHQDRCPTCVGWHIAVLRHTVAKLLGNWHMVDLVKAGGLLNQKDEYGTLPGHSLGT